MPEPPAAPTPVVGWNRPRSAPIAVAVTQLTPSGTIHWLDPTVVNSAVKAAVTAPCRSTPHHDGDRRERDDRGGAERGARNLTRLPPVQPVAGAARRRERATIITVAAVPAANAAPPMAPAYARRRPLRIARTRLPLTRLLDRGEGLRKQAGRGLEVAGAQQVEPAQHLAVASELGLAAQARLDVALHREVDGRTAVDRCGKDACDVVTLHGRPPPSFRACRLLVEKVTKALAAPMEADLGRRHRDAELLGDLLVRQAVDVFQHDEHAQLRRQCSTAPARRSRAADCSAASSGCASGCGSRSGPRGSRRAESARWRRRRLTVVYAVFAVMRYIHVVNCASPRKPSRPFQARR